MKKDDLIKFVRTKDYKFVEEIGQGGTGRTVLLEDEIIGQQFVCKKYSTFYPEHKETFFDYFKSEIKLLHLLNHKNIVRVYNYYLYPDDFTGYILMEFIKGDSISSYLKSNPDKFNDVFEQTINAFSHLEENAILHRDIRPENILVADDGTVKIIDFGFSKKIDFTANYQKSVSLNWRYTPPQEFNNEVYDFRTELYFVGKLFEEIILENDLRDFSYTDTLYEMVIHDYEKRLSSFFNLSREIVSESSEHIWFSDQEKLAYKEFAVSFQESITRLGSNFEYIRDIDTVKSRLKQLHMSSILEDFIQNNSQLIKCFGTGDFEYVNNNTVYLEQLKKFIELFKSASKERQKIVMNNLWQRLDSIPRVSSFVEDDDLPF